MNQVVVACEVGHCPPVMLVVVHQEADIGSCKSYEFGCRNPMRHNGVVLVCVASLVGGWCFTDKCSLLVWLITPQCKL